MYRVSGNVHKKRIFPASAIMWTSFIFNMWGWRFIDSARSPESPRSYWMLRLSNISVWTWNHTICCIIAQLVKDMTAINLLHWCWNLETNVIYCIIPWHKNFFRNVQKKSLAGWNFNSIVKTFLWAQLAMCRFKHGLAKYVQYVCQNNQNFYASKCIVYKRYLHVII